MKSQVHFQLWPTSKWSSITGQYVKGGGFISFSECKYNMYNTNTGNFIWFSRWHEVVNHVFSVPSVCRGLCWDIMEFKGSEWKWFLPQQHPPDEGLTVVPGVSFTLGLSPPPAVAPGPILFLISAAMVMKACSTLVAFLALVSKKGIPRESANSWTQHKRGKVRSFPVTAVSQPYSQRPRGCMLYNGCTNTQYLG